MLRTLLIATTLLSGTAFAYDGRVITVEPNITFSFGTRHHDGFRVLYEFGGHQYWTHTPHHPGHTIVLPPQHQVNVYHHYDNGWRDRRHDWDDDDGRPGRGHGRYYRKHHRSGHHDD
ncbi:MAG: hypothetical protein M1449_03330 [Candidatus Thermoplasmatota archaeon]|nr:hypothetical protein [Candidatus Thermoplasmatota archaeon]